MKKKMKKSNKSFAMKRRLTAMTISRSLSMGKYSYYLRYSTTREFSSFKLSFLKFPKLPIPSFSLLPLKLDRFIPFRNKNQRKEEESEFIVLDKYLNFVQKLKKEVNMNSINELSTQNLLKLRNSIQSSIEQSPYDSNGIPIIKTILNELDTFQNESITENLNDIFTSQKNADNSSSSSLELLESKQSQLNSSYRIILLKEYCKILTKLLSDGEIQSKSFHPLQASKLVDSFLFGNSAERLTEHLGFYGKTITAYTFQSSMNLFLENEIQVISSLIVKTKDTPKSYKKIVLKFMNTYLFDKLESNVKSRCVFAWSDPEYTGFKPIADDRQLPTISLLKGRREFFKEAEEISYRFLYDFMAERRVYYHNRKEFRETMMMGAVFFIVTCLVDWYICVM